MPRYRYKARNLDGQAVEAVVEAANDDALERELARQGLMLITSAPEEQRRRSIFDATLNPRSIRLSRSDLIFLTMEIGTSYSAGLPILATLEDMAESSESRNIAGLVKGLADRVRGGSGLAEALAAYPRSFPALYIDLVGAAEKTGKLETILEDIVRFLEWQKETKSQIVGATIYPISMLGAVIMLTLVLTLFVFPRFMKQFVTSGAELPLPTLILLGADRFFRQNFIAIAAFAIISPFVYGAIRNLKPVRWQIDLFKLRVPVIGPLVTKILMSRFTHNLAMMLASGLDFSAALRMCERLMENAVLTQLVMDARIGVEQGKPLSESLAKGNYMPSLVKRMLKLGENTGEMEKSLEHVSRYYDKEIPKAIKRMFQVMEPLMLILMAGVVLFMAAAVLLPLYRMIASIGGKD